MRQLAIALLLIAVLVVVGTGSVDGAAAFATFATTAFATTVNTTVTKPTGTADGDVLIATIGCDQAVAVTGPAGWTEYAASPRTWQMGNLKQYYYWKRASSEGASWTWTHGNAQNWGVVVRYTGVFATGDPNDATATVNSADGTANAIASGITTGNANSLGIIFLTFWNGHGGTTPPSGFTINVMVDSYEMDKIFVAAGATGDQTTVFAGADDWTTFFTALRASAAAANQPPGSKLLLGVGR